MSKRKAYARVKSTVKSSWESYNYIALSLITKVKVDIFLSELFWG